VPVFELPFRQKLYENILFDHEAFDKITEIIKSAEVKKTSFLERVKEAIAKELKDEVVKVLAYIILKAQKEIDAREVAVKYGFVEQKPFVLTITDDSMENVITRVVMRVKEGKLVVVSKPERVDFEIVAPYRVLARMIMGKAKVNGQVVPYDPVDAWLKGDLVIYGVGAVPRALDVLKNVLSDEAFLSDVRDKFGKVLERWI
jgi:hypothetical protein